MPAETNTATAHEDHLQSAIDSAIEGILPRIVRKVSTLLGGEGMSREGPPPPATYEGPTPGRRGETDQNLVTH